jgi:hypothetical protein
MNRRDFLKFGGLISMAVFLRIKPRAVFLPDPVQVVVAGKIYRGTPDGKIYISDDEGVSWRLHTDLGKDNAILELFTNPDGQVFAQVGYQKFSFVLRLSQNGRNWHSASGSRTV